MAWNITNTSTWFASLPEIFLSLVCFLFLFYYVNRRSRLPVNWPVVGMLPSLFAHADRLRDFGTDVLSAAGCTFVFHGPPFLNLDAVVTCDPNNIHHVFTTNFTNYPKGAEYADIFDILGGGILNSDGESWKTQRRSVQLFFAHPRFRSFVTNCSRDKVLNSLVPLLTLIAEQNRIVDLQDVLLRLTFDCICTVVLGSDPKSLSPDFPVLPSVKAIDDIGQSLFFLHLFPKYLRKLTKWLKVGPAHKITLAWVVIDHFLADIIAKRREERKMGGREGTADAPPADLLTAYIDDEEGGDHDQSNKFLRDTTFNLVLAGLDSTGGTLSWFFWLLSKNPNVEKKIVEELKLKNEDSELVYLHAALCECLRLYPPVAIEFKGVLQPDVLPSGVAVKSGIHLLFNAYSMGRMESVWGKDCMEFKPERWITKQGKVRHVPAYKFFSFNCGPRTCLGKNIAFTQMKATVSAILSNFEVEVVEGQVIEPKLCVILQIKNGLKVRIKKRGDGGCCVELKLDDVYMHVTVHENLSLGLCCLEELATVKNTEYNSKRCNVK